MKTIIFETIKELKQLFCFHQFIYDDFWHYSKDYDQIRNLIIEVKCKKCGAMDFSTPVKIARNPKKFKQGIK